MIDFRIPAAADTDSPGAPRSRSGRGQRILLLDDDPTFVELTRRAIGTAGYSVVGHTSPSAALADFTAAPRAYNLVVTDLLMPDVNGLDFAQSVVAIRGDIPIVIMAESMSPQDEALAAAHGVREVVTKSATVEELCRAFERIFGD
jgi:two-component system cell cycle sensor histidine kinase/response regulator CckA